MRTYFMRSSTWHTFCTELAQFKQGGPFAKSHPGNRVVATLSGRLEAPEHFEIRTDPLGILHARVFGSYFAAMLSFWSLGHFRGIPTTRSEEEAEIIERLRDPEPKRVR